VIRGFANLNSQNLLGNILRINKPKLVLFAEPMSIYSDVYVKFFIVLIFITYYARYN